MLSCVTYFPLLAIANGTNGSKPNIREYTLAGMPTTEVNAPLDTVVSPDTKVEVTQQILDGEMDPRDTFDTILNLQMRTQVQSLLTTYCDELNVAAGNLDEIPSIRAVGNGPLKTVKPKNPRPFSPRQPSRVGDSIDPFSDLHDTVEELVSVIREHAISQTMDPEEQVHSYSPDYTLYFKESLSRNERDYIDRLLRRAAEQDLMEYVEDCGYSFDLRRETWGDILDDPKIAADIAITRESLAKQFLLLGILYTVQLKEDEAPLFESVLLGRTAKPGELARELASGRMCIYPEMQFSLDDMRESHRTEVDAHIDALNTCDANLRSKHSERVAHIHLPPTSHMILDWRLPCIHDNSVWEILESRFRQTSETAGETPHPEDVQLWLESQFNLDEMSWMSFLAGLEQTIPEADSEYVRDSLMLSRHVHYLAKHLTRLFTKNGGNHLLTANLRTRLDVCVVTHTSESISAEANKSIRLARRRKAENGNTRRGVSFSGNEMMSRILSWDKQGFRPWQRATFLETPERERAEEAISYATVMDALLGVTRLLTECSDRDSLRKIIMYEDISRATGGRVSEPQWQVIWKHVLLPELTRNSRLTHEPGEEHNPLKSLSEWATEKAQEQRDEARDSQLSHEHITEQLQIVASELKAAQARMKFLGIGISVHDTPPPVDETEYESQWEAQLAVEAQMLAEKLWMTPERRKAIDEATRLNDDWESLIHNRENLSQKQERALRRAEYFDSMSNQLSQDSFVAFPLGYLLRCSRIAASKMLDQYKAAGGEVHEGYDIRLVECKIPRPYRANVNGTLSKARSKEGHRQQMGIRSVLGEIREMNQPFDEWYRSIIGLNILLNGQFISFSSDIIALPSWEPDAIASPECSSENFEIIRQRLDTGNVTRTGTVDDYYEIMKKLKLDLLYAIEDWTDRQKNGNGESQDKELARMLESD